MKISSYQPQDLLLQQYIAQIYFLSLEAGDEPYAYLAFPGMGYFVNINAETEVNRDHALTHYWHQSGSLPLIELIHNFSEPHLLRYEGKIQEITICFHPLGLNAFLERPLSDYFGKEEAAHFAPFPDFLEFIGQLLNMEKSCNNNEAVDGKITDYSSNNLR